MPPAKRAATTAKPKASVKKAAASKPSSAAKRQTKAAPSKTAASKGSSSKASAGKASSSKAPAGQASSKTTQPPATRAARSASTATARRTSASQSKRTEGARAAAARVRQAASTDSSVISIAEQLVTGAVSPKDVVMLTRERIQETLDDAASRGRMTRKDANELVAELLHRGRSGGDDVLSEIEGLLAKGRNQVETATKRAARSEPVDRIVRGADRARRAAGVGSSFPISGYPELNVSQVQSRLRELSKPELRKVLTYERDHANRKSVVGAIQKSL